MFSCETFKNKMSRAARLAIVKKHNLCFNCLSSGHSMRDCPSKLSCRICIKSGKVAGHHTLIHPDGTDFHAVNHDSKSSVAPV